MKLVRDAAKVLSHLKETSANQVFTDVPCRIQMPHRFTGRGLGKIGIDTFCIGCFPIILETGEYTVCNVNALIELNPYKTIEIKIEDIPYYELYFEADQPIIITTTVVQNDDLIYNVLDELIIKGKIPWYMEYEDIGKLFDTAKSHANSNVGQNLEVIELIASIISRSSADRTKYLREVITDYKDVAKDSVDFLPLNSVFYSVNSTLNKLAGNYFNYGVSSALVTNTDKVSKLEKIVRA